MCTTRTAEDAECSHASGGFRLGGFYDSEKPGGAWQEGGLGAEEQKTSFWFGSSSDSEGEPNIGLHFSAPMLYVDVCSVLVS